MKKTILIASMFIMFIGCKNSFEQETEERIQYNKELGIELEAEYDFSIAKVKSGGKATSDEKIRKNAIQHVANLHMLEPDWKPNQWVLDKFHKK